MWKCRMSFRSSYRQVSLINLENFEFSINPGIYPIANLMMNAKNKIAPMHIQMVKNVILVRIAQISLALTNIRRIREKNKF